KGPQMKTAILHPEMTPGAGTWDKPMATLGVKPTEPWTATTTAAGVDNKPQPGKPITVVGEVVDFSCYLQLGKHGDKRRSCGQNCSANGEPAGLLTETGALYMLMPEEHDPRRDAEWMRRHRRRTTWGTSSRSTGRRRASAGIARFLCRGSRNSLVMRGVLIL